MTFTTYTEARAALDGLKARAYANESRLRGNTPVDEVEAVYAVRREIAAEAKAAGFIRIFDGSYKLNADQVALID